jgi:tRNA threonylcarbamoyladenosine biosynthesis protein TsaE
MKMYLLRGKIILMIYTEQEIDKAVNFFLKEVGVSKKSFWEFFMENFSKKDFKNKFHNVVGLSGDLGAGKTTFTKHLLKKLGYTGSVPSPTFVLRRDYELNDKNFKRLIHIDAYRLEKPEDFYQVVNKEDLLDKKNLVVVEWPEKTEKNIFDKVFKFDHVSENLRRISLL